MPEFYRHELARVAGQEFIRTRCICCGVVGKHLQDSDQETGPLEHLTTTALPNLPPEPTSSVATKAT
jgi:hypothetical protein